nr:hypothetical protein [Tanacetum cinerariifolium]
MKRYDAVIAMDIYKMVGMPVMLHVPCKKQFSICETGFVVVGEHVTPSACGTFWKTRVDTPVCAMIPQSSVGTDVHSNLPSVNGRPHVREENQRYYATTVPRYNTCCMSGQPKKDVKNDIISLFEKGNNTTSPYVDGNRQPGGTSLPKPGMIMPVPGNDDFAKYLQQVENMLKIKEELPLCLNDDIEGSCIFQVSVDYFISSAFSFSTIAMKINGYLFASVLNLDSLFHSVY